MVDPWSESEYDRWYRLWDSDGFARCLDELPDLPVRCVRCLNDLHSARSEVLEASLNARDVHIHVGLLNGLAHVTQVHAAIFPFKSHPLRKLVKPSEDVTNACRFLIVKREFIHLQQLRDGIHVLNHLNHNLNPQMLLEIRTK